MRAPPQEERRSRTTSTVTGGECPANRRDDAIPVSGQSSSNLHWKGNDHGGRGDGTGVEAFEQASLGFCNATVRITTPCCLTKPPGSS